MGPPEVWQAPEGPTLAPQRPGQHQSALDGRAAAKSPGAALHEALQQQLRSGKIGILCHVICMQLSMLYDGASSSGQSCLAHTSCAQKFCTSSKAGWPLRQPKHSRIAQSAAATHQVHVLIIACQGLCEASSYCWKHYPLRCHTGT